MSPEQITAVFDAWWKDSFPMAPPSKASRESFVAFGLFLLEQVTPTTTPTPHA